MNGMVGTELWNEEVTQCITKSNIKFNSCLIFKTNDISEMAA